MHRSLRFACWIAVVASIGLASPVEAQYIFVDASVTPNPYTYTDNVDVDINVFFDEHIGWSYPTGIHIDVTGSNGYYGHFDDALFQGMSSYWTGFSDPSASSQYSGVNYSIYVWIDYFDPEWGQYFQSGPSYDVAYASYSPPGVPDGETTESGGWNTQVQNLTETAHDWIQTLTGGSFDGRHIHEESGGGGPDTCYFPGAATEPQQSVSGGAW